MRPGHAKQWATGLTYILGAAMLGFAIGAAVAALVTDIEEAMSSPPPAVTWPELPAPGVPAQKEEVWEL